MFGIKILEVVLSDSLIIILERGMHPKLLLKKVSITYSLKNFNNASHKFGNDSLEDCKHHKNK